MTKHRPNIRTYEIDQVWLQDTNEPFDTLCIVAYGAILTLTLLFWGWVILNW